MSICRTAALLAPASKSCLGEDHPNSAAARAYRLQPLQALAKASYRKPMLVPYWIECLYAPGVGITAQSELDTLALLENAFGGEIRPGRVARVHDATELDHNHVVPNMGNWLKRGVWYPRGYEDSAQ